MSFCGRAPQTKTPVSKMKPSTVFWSSKRTGFPNQPTYSLGGFSLLTPKISTLTVSRSRLTSTGPIWMTSPILAQMSGPTKNRTSWLITLAWVTSTKTHRKTGPCSIKSQASGALKLTMRASSTCDSQGTTWRAMQMTIITLWRRIRKTSAQLRTIW